DRPGNVLGRHITRDHAPQEAHGERALLPRLAHRGRDGRERAVALHGLHRFWEASAAAECGSKTDLADRTALFNFRLRHERELEPLAVAEHGDTGRLAGTGTDDVDELHVVVDGLSLDVEDTVADCESCGRGGEAWRQLADDDRLRRIPEGEAESVQQYAGLRQRAALCLRDAQHEGPRRAAGA